MVTEKLREEGKRIAEEAGYEVVEIQIKPLRRSNILQLFVDRDGGITVDECADLSKRVSDWIEAYYPEYSESRIEVSSPGLDRPLKTEKDFRRQLGREINVQFRQEEKIMQVTGVLRSVSEDGFIFVEYKEKPRCISIASIFRANIKLQW